MLGTATLQLDMDISISTVYDFEDPKVCNLESHSLTKIPSPTIRSHIFRLLELMPGAASDPLVANLSTHALEQAPAYDAISYVWGSTKSVQTLRCNQKEMSMTLNLEAALRRIRFQDRSRTIWVDAICIDQGNDRERSHHVTFMNEVYSKATQVLACMGQDAAGGEANVAALIEEHVKRMADSTSVSQMPILSKTDPILSDPRWASLRALMRSAWFGRAWVLQEVGVAKDPRVLYGFVEFSYRDLMRLARWIVRCAASLQQVAGIDLLTVHTDWEDWSDNWRQSAEHEYTLLDFLSHAKGLGCHDKHDHVYAFLGHPLLRQDDGSGPIVTPDYENKTVEGLYTELTKWMLPRLGLSVLSAVEHDEKTINEAVPSWVVRWNMDVIWNSMGYYPDFYYRASGPDDPKAFVTPQDSLLKVQAMYVDVVTATYEFFGEAEDWETTDARTFLRPMNAVHNALGSIWRDVNNNSTPRSCSHDQRLDALSLTLGAGLRNYECAEKDLEQYRANFVSFWDLRHEILAKDPIPDQFQHLSIQGVADDFLFDMNLSCKGRAFFITKSGRYGLGPFVTKPGDECHILNGARVPFVLRRQSDQGPATLVGEAYIHGIMHGEILNDSCVDGEWSNLHIE